MDRGKLNRIAARNFGLFTRAQATECGYSEYQIRHRLRCGDWQVVLGRTLAPSGLTITTAIRDRAAQLSVPGSILAGASAARVLRVGVPDDRTFLYVGPHGRMRLPGVVALHSTPDRRDVNLFQGLPAVTIQNALVECLLWLPERAAIDLLDRGLQRGWLVVSEFDRRVENRRGTRGYLRLAAMRDLIRGGERAESERRLTALLREAGITGWAANVPIYDDEGLMGVVDVAFKRERAAIEVDGFAFHAEPDRFERDRERQNRITRAGWAVARYTWRQLTQRPEYVLNDIAARLARVDARADSARPATSSDRN